MAEEQEEHEKDEMMKVEGAAEDECIKGENTPPQLHARVVGIIRRNWRQYAGSIDSTPLPRLEGHSEDANVKYSNGSHGEEEELGIDLPTGYLFTPVDKKVPPIAIETRTISKLQGNRMLVCVDSWPAYAPYPLGHFVRILGKDGEKDVETAVYCRLDAPHDHRWRYL